ncbi:hypothetical protein AcV7_008347 [Taiwanofungus camphoratus]|nr:hypothetical protein AcV7_008347 [Antrodia cinnamomea]
MQLPEGAAWVRPARVAESEVEKPKKPGVVAWRVSGYGSSREGGCGEWPRGCWKGSRRGAEQASTVDGGRGTVSGRWEGNDEEMVMVMMGFNLEADANEARTPETAHGVMRCCGHCGSAGTRREQAVVRGG